jgi:hypothetical protein
VQFPLKAEKVGLGEAGLFGEVCWRLNNESWRIGKKDLSSL